MTRAMSSGQRRSRSGSRWCSCPPPHPTPRNNVLRATLLVLEVAGLYKRFGGFTAVNNVSCKVEQGEILGLIGPNGSGKSTIFNMLSGTLAPSAGSIVFARTEIAGLAPHRIIVSGIGRTFQIPRPFRRLSIFENVALAGYYGQGSHSRARGDGAGGRALGNGGLSAGGPDSGD